MNRNLILFLKFIVLLVGALVLTFMLWEPHLEGRNVNADLFTIYFRDSFLAYAYIGSIPFFVALYQSFKLLGYVGEKNVSSQRRALQIIKYCGLLLFMVVIGGEIFLFSMGVEENPPVLMMGLIGTVISLGIANIAAVLEKKYYS